MRSNLKINQSGFTLVEVMVAITITALMLTAVYQTVSTTSNARQKLAYENSRHHMARIVTERIGRELQSLHYDPADARTRFLGGITSGDMELLTFSSTASTPLSKIPGLPARISYRLQQDLEAEREIYTLNRIETAILDVDEGKTYKLAGELSQVEINFLKDDRWTTHWDSIAKQTLPDAVSLTITSGHGQDETVFRTVWQIGAF